MPMSDQTLTRDRSSDTTFALPSMNRLRHLVELPTPRFYTKNQQRAEIAVNKTYRSRNSRCDSTGK